MVSQSDRVAVGFGSLAVDNRRLEAENIVLRQAVGDMQHVLKGALKLIEEKEAKSGGDPQGSTVTMDPPWA